MGLAFVVLYPLGALLVRAFRFKGAVWIHVACQMAAWICMIVGFVMGHKAGNILDLV
jgi:hypothetical protein